MSGDRLHLERSQYAQRRTSQFAVSIRVGNSHLPLFLIPKLQARGLQRVHRLIHAGESHAFQMRASTVECIGVDFVAFTKRLGTHK